MSKRALRRMYSELKSAGKFVGTIDEAVAKRASRSANQPVDRFSNRRSKRIEDYLALREWLSSQHPIPLGDAVEKRFMDIAKSAWSKYREWSLGAVPTTFEYKSGFGLRQTGNTGGPRRRSTFRRGIAVRSTPIPLSTPRVLRIVVGTDEYSIPAPRGYRWSKDQNGIFLVNSKGDGYHPTASEMIGMTHDRGRGVVASLKSNAITRRANARKEKKRGAEWKRMSNEVWVCLKDSLSAGNCAAGTLSWVNSHTSIKKVREKLGASGHVPLSYIIPLANETIVSAVVASAIRRHTQEMRQGYCIVSEHVTRS